MGGFPKENKQKKNVLCENSVEVWGNDGNFLLDVYVSTAAGGVKMQIHLNCQNYYHLTITRMTSDWLEKGKSPIHVLYTPP